MDSMPTGKRNAVASTKMSRRQTPRYAHQYNLYKVHIVMSNYTHARQRWNKGKLSKDFSVKSDLDLYLLIRKTVKADNIKLFGAHS